MASIILGSNEKETARHGSAPQSSKVAILKDESHELAFINTSKVAPISSSIGLVKVKVRSDRSWDIQDG